MSASRSSGARVDVVRRARRRPLAEEEQPLLAAQVLELGRGDLHQEGLGARHGGAVQRAEAEVGHAVAVQVLVIKILREGRQFFERPRLRPRVRRDQIVPQQET